MDNRDIFSNSGNHGRNSRTPSGHKLSDGNDVYSNSGRNSTNNRNGGRYKQNYYPRDNRPMYNPTGANNTPSKNTFGNDIGRNNTQANNFGRNNTVRNNTERNSAVNNTEKNNFFGRRNNTPSNRAPINNVNSVYSDVSSQSSKPPKKARPPKKNGGFKKVLIALVCIVLAFGLGIGGLASSIVGKFNYNDKWDGKNEYISSDKLASSSSVKNILLIGSDARSDVRGNRSDSMILASIDTKNKRLKLTSFLRDSLVYIPAKRHWNKLNAACSFGGAKMLIDTLEYNFKVKIDGYVMVDFEVFTDFINAIGGIDVDGITKAEVDWLKRNVKGINIHEGTSHLTGGAALWYCRVRKTDSDFGRTARQRKVIGSIVKAVEHTSPLKTIKAINLVVEKIETSLSKNELMSLGVNGILKYLRYDTFRAQVPAKGTWWDKTYRIGAVLEMKIDKNAEILKDFVYSKQTDEE